MVELSVLLPVYNAQDFISQAIESILKQTFENFELVIIDDGSTDNTAKIISNFVDKRIRYFKNENNLKLIETLNKGISLCVGKYLARMDADDICHPQRFELQIAHLKNNPETAVVGSNIIFIDRHNRIIGRGIKAPETHHAIVWEFLKRCALYHPTVMINKELIGSELSYDSNYPHAEDYELWMRLSRKFKLANMSQDLLRYRIHKESITAKYSDESLSSMMRAITKNAPISLSERELFLYRMPWKVNHQDDVSILINNIGKELDQYCNSENVQEREIRILRKSVFSRLFFLIIYLVSITKTPQIYKFIQLKKVIKVYQFEIFQCFMKMCRDFYHRFFKRFVFERGK
ncbi:MAG: glycosyltransferase [Halobacteriovoraceae bacterium]|nr:glycosyltransferase [Halobacteriovoraceae bacterium]